METHNEILLINRICNDLMSNAIDSYITEPIDSSQRYSIYKIVETYTELETETIKIEGVQDKKKILIKKKEITLVDNKISNINCEQIDWFIKYSKLPIPINSPEHIDYYIKLFEPFYSNSHELYYDYFLNDIKSIGFNKMKSDINYIKNEILKLFNSNQKYKKFLSDKTTPSYSENFITKNHIYHPNNVGLNLLSIDIKSANWTCLKKICDGDFDDSWEYLVSKYTPSKFLQKSKYLREVIFGELGSKKLNKFIGEFIWNLDQEICKNQELNNILVKIVCSMDEIIYSVKNPESFDFNKFIQIINHLDSKNQIYRVEQFILKQIEPYTYYIKEIMNSNSIVCKINFKQIPKHFIPQVIKFYKKEEINEFDKKFMFENIISTFDKPLIFDKII
jgi:hypothetical protein